LLWTHRQPLTARRAAWRRKRRRLRPLRRPRRRRRRRRSSHRLLNDAIDVPGCRELRRKGRRGPGQQHPLQSARDAASGHAGSSRRRRASATTRYIFTDLLDGPQMVQRSGNDCAGDGIVVSARAGAPEEGCKRVPHHAGTNPPASDPRQVRRRPRSLLRSRAMRSDLPVSIIVPTFMRPVMRSTGHPRFNIPASLDPFRSPALHDIATRPSPFAAIRRTVTGLRPDLRPNLRPGLRPKRDRRPLRAAAEPGRVLRFVRRP
jgi:hypothetical protein